MENEQVGCPGVWTVEDRASGSYGDVGQLADLIRIRSDVDFDASWLNHAHVLSCNRGVSVAVWLAARLCGVSTVDMHDAAHNSRRHDRPVGVVEGIDGSAGEFAQVVGSSCLAGDKTRPTPSAAFVSVPPKLATRVVRLLGPSLF